MGDGVTDNTVAFERAVSAIGKLRKKGGAQLNVPPGVWLTAPFNLTSYMTLFLAEDAVILGIDVSSLSLSLSLSLSHTHTHTHTHTFAHSFFILCSCSMFRLGFSSVFVMPKM